MEDISFKKAVFVKNVIKPSRSLADFDPRQVEVRGIVGRKRSSYKQWIKFVQTVNCYIFMTVFR